jgi:hypothetical protein
LERVVDLHEPVHPRRAARPVGGGGPGPELSLPARSPAHRTLERGAVR